MSFVVMENKNTSIEFIFFFQNILCNCVLLQLAAVWSQLCFQFAHKHNQTAIVIKFNTAEFLQILHEVGIFDIVVVVFSVALELSSIKKELCQIVTAEGLG